jgi:hypothetical protein
MGTWSPRLALEVLNGRVDEVTVGSAWETRFELSHTPSSMSPYTPRRTEEASPQLRKPNFDC